MRKGKRLEAFDKQDNVDVCLQVCDLAKDADVKAFAERLQMEALDTDNRFFLRLRNIALALPGRLALVEDLPRRTLWHEFSCDTTNPNLGAKLACVANSVLSGLCRLHANGWTHCGISPETVCLAGDGHWKLTSLELARKVRTLDPMTLFETGTAVPPEVLLGLPVTEKVDVWQLAASLCEALMQKRLFADGSGGASLQTGVAVHLCILIDFLGPLPSSLVAQHPDRESIFTPEGHILRPATPGGTGLEAIEPPTESSNGSIPRPRYVEGVLKNIENHNEILEFLGQLLNPDPEQRPSAQEATAHHFLRFAHMKTQSQPAAKQGCRFDDDQAPKHPHACINDKHGDNENKIARKGTGFVHIGELPPSDDEDEDEDEGPPKAAHVEIKEEAGHTENKIARKGTGFVHVGELPPSDDEDEDEEPVKKAHVHMEEEEDAQLKTPNKMARKGTGFVHVGELPPSDEEDEDEPPAAAHAKFAEDAEPEKHAGGKMARKGTGFVHVGELPPSDEEDEDDEPVSKVKVEETQGHSENKIARKGTGFVHVGELPPSDDEDEEEEETKKPHVEIQEEAGHKENKLARKGTGFVHAGELPPSDEEDEDEEPVKKAHVHMAEEQEPEAVQQQKAPNKIARKGTGFVHLNELPASDEEDEDEEPVKKEHIQIAEDKEHVENKIARKGTGFVHMGELPPSDDEDEEEEEKPHVQVVEEAGHVENKLSRKGTGFVHAGELPPSDDEDEEEAPHVKIQEDDAESHEKGSPGKMARKGTGFVHMGELPPSDDEDEDEEPPARHVDFSGDIGGNGEGQSKPKARAGTGFVSAADLNFDDEDDEDDE
jgi:serine/threonine protein kinase